MGGAGASCSVAPAPLWAARVSVAGASGSGRSGVGGTRVSSRVNRAGRRGSTPGGNGLRAQRQRQQQHSEVLHRTCAVVGGTSEHDGQERQQRQVREHRTGEGGQQGEQGWAQGQHTSRRPAEAAQQQHRTLLHRACAVVDGTSERVAGASSSSRFEGMGGVRVSSRMGRTERSGSSNSSIGWAGSST